MSHFVTKPFISIFFFQAQVELVKRSEADVLRGIFEKVRFFSLSLLKI